MINNDLHKLLKKQLEKLGLDLINNPIYDDFLSTISDTYKSFNNEVNSIKNILGKSSKELFIANKKLIHERDHTKTQLENIVANVGGVIFETDLKGNFTFLNKVWEEYSGITLENSLGKNFIDFLNMENVSSNQKLDLMFFKKKKNIKFIFKFERKGKTMWYEVKSKLFFNKKEHRRGFIGTIIDITNLKNTEIELHKASKSKDEFLSTMSHEIRTPLNAVTGLTNILLMEDYLPEQTENLKALKYSSDHLLGLINDLLDFNKIKSGKIKLNEKEFNLKYFLKNIKSHHDIRAKEKGLIFKLETEEDLPLNIIGDELKLTQIIKNLLSNSIKFTTQKGHITLSVKNLGIDKNKVKLEFKVKDNGIGISKSRQKTIFESFMQANPLTSVMYGGTGLGLAISKELLSLHNSDLKVESKLGKGAVFSFIINYKVSNRLNLFEPEMVETQPDYKPLNIKVLVAEDNKMNVLILKRFFMKWKVDFEIAEHGMRVLEILKETDFDVILMDLQMPILDGYKTAKAIRELANDKSKTPIIALTAFAQTDIKNKTKRYKMNDFLGKPFNPIELYKLLRSYSNKYKSK